MDSITISYLLMFGALIISGGASLMVRSAYSKYDTIEAGNEENGASIARKILDKNGLNNVHVVEVKGNLTDHYDPTRKVVRLSSRVFHGNTIAANAIAAHEVGHAIQDKEGYAMMRLRSLLVPVVNLSTNIGYFVVFIGFIAGAFDMITIGIMMVSLMLLFQLITLPVEFDASRRAKEELKDTALLGTEAYEGAAYMLTAAAMTYVAGVLSTILTIARLLILRGDRD